MKTSFARNKCLKVNASNFTFRQKMGQAIAKKTGYKFPLIICKIVFKVLLVQKICTFEVRKAKNQLLLLCVHRRRIKTEERAKGRRFGGKNLLNSLLRKLFCL